MKKVISLVLCVVLVFALMVPAFAIENDYISGVDALQNNSSPIFGEFVADSEMLAIIAEKEAWAYGVANSIKRSRSSYTITLPISQVAQETNYWCGYAAMKSITDYEGYSMSQQALARVVFPTGTIGGLPWYWNNGSGYTDFPAATTLRQYSSWYYVPYPYGAAGTTAITASALEDRIIGDIDSGYGVLADGASVSGESSFMPGYPATTVWHWLVIYGYADSGNTIYIADPAKSSAVSWSGNISAYYTISSSKLAAYAAPRGIIW